MKSATLAALLAVTCLGAVTFAQTISFDFDRSAAFASYKTYGWVKGTDVPDPLIHQRLVNAVDVQLALKGLIQVHRQSSPDLRVAYHASFDKDLQITGFGSGWGGFRFGGSRSGTARAEEILTGTMVVDLIDARTDSIVWRGTASKDIDVKASPEKRDKNITKTAQKLFKHYPPKQTS
jgi:hypothetical protein